MLNKENCKPIRKKHTQTKETHNTNPSQQIHTKRAKSLKKLEYNVAYTTNNIPQRHLTDKTTHNTKHENTHPQVYANLNVTTVLNSILVKWVDFSKHINI